MNNIHCMGSETRIEDCNYEGWGTNNCGHGEDLSISCIPSNNILLIIHSSKQSTNLSSNRTLYFGLLRAYFALCFFNITENKSVTLSLIKQYIELTDLLQHFFLSLHCIYISKHSIWIS